MMPFDKGENGKMKRKAIAITPSSVPNTAVPIAVMRTALRTISGENDWDTSEQLKDAIENDEDFGEATRAAVLAELNDRAFERIHKATVLKERLEDVAEDTVLDQFQDKMIQAITKMNGEGLDKVQGFFALGLAKVAFIRHTSPVIHPEYKLEELMMEALKKLENNGAANKFGYSDRHRTRIRASSGASSGANAYSGYTDEPPTMEGITQRGLDGC
jgi:hypothetical protein